ncbi:MAG: phosphatase PAP2 family protein [Bacteroidales bacterium]|nr:phosphatase PAP2 family protein [Bacteroidales bacterium]
MKRLFTAALVLLICTPLCRAQVSEYAYPEKYIQYMPAVMDLTLDFAGIKAENRFVDRLLTLGIGTLSCAALVNGIKYTVGEERPDGSAFNSFPSGHSATAFMGAELVRHEYGWGWGGAAYALATSVAVLRVVHQRHWWWDTLAGAGVGILSANIGYWLMEPVENLLGISKPAGQIALCPTVDPMSGAVCATFAMRF